jgi:hypothetical protein
VTHPLAYPVSRIHSLELLPHHSTSVIGLGVWASAVHAFLIKVDHQVRQSWPWQRRLQVTQSRLCNEAGKWLACRPAVGTTNLWA